MATKAVNKNPNVKKDISKVKKIVDKCCFKCGTTKDVTTNSAGINVCLIH